MGISGLLPLLKDIHRPVHLRQYKNQWVAVDAYVWLHKGAFGCAFDLCQGNPTTKYVDFCMKKVEQLKEHGIFPILVFDGGHLPMKAQTEKERRKKREENRRLGREFLRKGHKTKALECFQTCVDVTPRMAHELIKALKQAEVDYVVAPYEADAQLTYLAKNGYVDAVISEDSDLLVFGCPRVIYKLDNQGNGIEIRFDELGSIPGMTFWQPKTFRQMCILSGCDYLESAQGIGIKKAQALFTGRSLKAEHIIKQWTTWGKAVNAPAKIPPDYLNRFRKAELTFLHQRVYDRKTSCLVPLEPFPENFEEEYPDTDFLGPDMPPDLATKIALGDVDPITKRPFDIARYAEESGGQEDLSPVDSAYESQNRGDTENEAPTDKATPKLFRFFSPQPSPIPKPSASQPQTFTPPARTRTSPSAVSQPITPSQPETPLPEHSHSCPPISQRLLFSNRRATSTLGPKREGPTISSYFKPNTLAGMMTKAIHSSSRGRSGAELVEAPRLIESPRDDVDGREEADAPVESVESEVDIAADSERGGPSQSDLLRNRIREAQDGGETVARKYGGMTFGATGALLKRRKLEESSSALVRVDGVGGLVGEVAVTQTGEDSAVSLPADTPNSRSVLPKGPPNIKSYMFKSKSFLSPMASKYSSDTTGPQSAQARMKRKST